MLISQSSLWPIAKCASGFVKALNHVDNCFQRREEGGGVSRPGRQGNCLVNGCSVELIDKVPKVPFESMEIDFSMKGLLNPLSIFRMGVFFCRSATNRGVTA